MRRVGTRRERSRLLVVSCEAAVGIVPVAVMGFVGVLLVRFAGCVPGPCIETRLAAGPDSVLRCVDEAEDASGGWTTEFGIGKGRWLE